MRISASVNNGNGDHQVFMTSGDDVHSIVIQPKAGGSGSSINGGELLFLALATCYCNDVYREAAKREIKVERVEVQVEGEFGSPGEPASKVNYRARVFAAASEEDILDLIQATDRLAEIQNTVRAAIPVTFSGAEAVRLGG